ncbi:MAG: amidohydrolase family protein [Emcibacteraceae bacterium]|nr:amidohydrolase family protein [Emcibacteraceae bacterium]
MNVPLHPTTINPNPTKPHFKVPPGAVDAHCHVFGPEKMFPYAPERKYTPNDAPKEKLFALRDYLGFERNVIVQASCHGYDNSALVDALETAGELARGVAIIDPEISDKELDALNKAGVRAVRFNFIKRLVQASSAESYLSIANRTAALGWHNVTYFEAPDLEELMPFLKQLPNIVVIDHMGRPNVADGIDHDDFQRILNFMDENKNFWIKVTCPERLSIAGSDYSAVVPFARTLVERFPDRVLWGTDWPHPNMKSHIPDDGLLVDFITKIATTNSLRQKLLVDNPMKLYWGQG